MKWRRDWQAELDTAARVAADAASDARFYKAAAETAERALAAATDREIRQEVRAKDWERMFFDLLERREGVTLRHEPEGEPRVAEAPDEMRELIDERAGENPRVRRMMLRQLAKDRRANVSDDKIRDAILNGVPSDGVPA